MFGESHDLATEFPEYKDKIHTLKMESKHFANLFEEYQTLDAQLHRTEQGIEVHADDFVESLKFKRLHLKDELYALLQTADCEAS
ncbi:MAG: hypothetical protein RI964_766 [Pseudomonadota bacterium]|jgi:uncharacterized protein YdcH (DUF465 family)